MFNFLKKISVKKEDLDKKDESRKKSSYEPVKYLEKGLQTSVEEGYVSKEQKKSSENALNFHTVHRDEKGKEEDKLTLGEAFKKENKKIEPMSKSIFHSDGDLIGDLKMTFTNEDGSSGEAVYSGLSIAWGKRGRSDGTIDPKVLETLTPLEDSKVKGTYNYVDVDKSAVGHFVNDVVPYLLYGVDGKSDLSFKGFVKRLKGFDNSGSLENNKKNKLDVVSSLNKSYFANNLNNSLKKEDQNIQAVQNNFYRKY